MECIHTNTIIKQKDLDHLGREYQYSYFQNRKMAQGSSEDMSHVYGTKHSSETLPPPHEGYRDPSTGPIRKLSVDLIKTYKHINEVTPMINIVSER